MTDGVDWQLLHRYAAGECTPTEAESLEQWLAADPSRSELLDSVRDLTARLAKDREPPVAWDTERKWQQVASKMRPLGTRRVMSAPARWPLRVAAAVVLLFSGTLAWWAVRFAESTSSAMPAMRQYVTPAGKRAELRLPDGTQVILGVASTLRLPVTYGQGTRDVHLEGEAYFAVTHDEARPFVVHARDLIAEDLGTEFVVRAYPDDPHASVVVREGVVAIGASRIEPGYRGYLRSTGAPVIEPADTAAAFAWTTGTLVFKDTPLSSAAPQLARWYDLEIHVTDDAPVTRRVTGSYRDEPIEQVLEDFALALGLRYERQGRTITFSAKQ